MGADIHCYIEHGRKPKNPDDKIHWSPFGYGGTNPGRDYDVFGLIAGVRRGNQMFALRGVPADAAFAATTDNTLFVVNDDSPEVNCERYTSRSNAESWVASGCSKWTNDQQQWVTNPDWHSHTWLTPVEWRLVIEHPSHSMQDYPLDSAYFAMAAAMEEFERRGEVARVIIWFDN